MQNRQKPFDLNKKKEKVKLENLYDRYQQCKSNDLKDLIDLESIIKKSNSLMNEDDRRASNFIKIFDNMEDDDFNKFLFIFEKYDLMNYTITDLLNNIIDSSKTDNFLKDLCATYKKYSDSLTYGGKKNAIDKISVYLNHLKLKSEQTQILFKKNI